MTDSLAILGHALGLSLLHFVWQGALIGVLVTLALRALRGATAQARYAVVCAALLLSLLMPLFTLWALLGEAAPSNVERQFGAASKLGATGFVAAPIDRGTLAALVPPQLGSAPYLASAVWLIGTSWMLLRLGLGLAWVGRLRRAPQDAGQGPWQARLTRLARSLGVQRRVTLLIVEQLDSPITMGWLRPVVLLPAALLTRMPVELIEALLAHELAHIRRHDYLVNLLQQVIEALLFFHPVVWWLSGRIRLERELIADQLASGNDASGSKCLARALHELSGFARDKTPATAMAANGGALLPRIQQLLRPQRAAAGGRVIMLLLALAAVGAASCAYAYVQLGQRTAFAQVSETVAPADASARRAVRLSFALVRGANLPVLAWGPDDYIDSAARAINNAQYPFLLVRRDGVDHVLSDARLLAPLVQSWTVVEQDGLKLDAKYQQLLREHEQAQQIGERIQRLQQNAGSADEELALSAQVRHADQRLQTLEDQIDQLARQVDAASAQMERDLHQLSALAPANRSLLAGD